jgi:hypothetical protein
MDEAFIIVQIGDQQLNTVCEQVIFPAITAAGFMPRRVDQHNQGDLLKSEIVRFIERSQIIVADVTNARPNCYLEIGYAMGLGKKANLILTAREDHHHSSPRFRRDGPKVHFDLEGYDILFWNPDDLPNFREDLTKRIARRAAIVRGSGSGTSQEPMAWRDALRARGERGLEERVGFRGYMEVTAQIQPEGDWSQSALLAAARSAQVSTFGWSVGVVLENEQRPRPTSDGIEADVASTVLGTVYDFWKVFRDGRFYTLMSLFEDTRAENTIFWESRVHRVTEALIFLVRLYRRLDASDTDQVTVSVRHAGLSTRTLRAGNQLRMTDPRTTTEDHSDAGFTTSLAELETDLFTYVKRIVQPLFVIFEFFDPDEGVLREIVEAYVAGRVI